MAEGMTQEQIDFQERVNSGTSPTNNEEFDKNGYLVLRNLWDPKDLYCEPPEVKGQYNYFGKVDKFNHIPVENQVEGSTSRYYWPPYKFAHSQIRLKLEEAIGKKLYNTYYYDRFYNPGQALTNHAESRSELKGKTLGCWCKPKKCHGDILLEIANDLRSRKDLEAGTFLGKYPSRIKGAVDSVRRSGVTVSKKVSTLPM